MRLTAQESEEFVTQVDKLVSPEISYLEALVQYAENEGMEVEVLAEMVKKNQVVTSRLREDAEKLNMLTEKTSRLSFDD